MEATSKDGQLVTLTEDHNLWCRNNRLCVVFPPYAGIVMFYVPHVNAEDLLQLARTVKEAMDQSYVPQATYIENAIRPKVHSL